MTCNGQVYSYTYTGHETLLPIYPGKYQLEVWGAQGGGQLGGKGGYSKGILTINKAINLYIFVGGKGSITKGGFNGGGDGGLGTTNALGSKKSDGGGGGGSTDIRLSKQISSRIIVAGGGGGACGNSWSSGGAGGGISGGSAEKKVNNNNLNSPGGTQIEGNLLDGQDAIDSKPNSNQGCEGNGGGGGGYRGGFSSQLTGDISNIGGGGGSSFISGAEDCKTIQNYVLEDYVMDQGINEGNGKATITILELYEIRSDQNSCKMKSFHFRFSNFFVSIFILNNRNK